MPAESPPRWRRPSALFALTAATIGLFAFVAYGHVPALRTHAPTVLDAAHAVAIATEYARVAGPPHSSVERVALRPTDESKRPLVRTVPVQLWRYTSHCGGAKLTTAKEAAMRHGAPAHGKRIYIKRGDTHDRQAPVLLSLVADDRGFVHIPYLSVDVGELLAPASAASTVTDSPAQDSATAMLIGEERRARNSPIVPSTHATLPSHRADSVFCLVDLERTDRELTAVARHQAEKAHGVEQHLHIDYECMQAKWRRCDYVLRLADPTVLASQPPKQPFVDPHARLRQTEEHAQPNRAAVDHHARERPVAIVEFRSPCRGRGECERWTGPRPK